MNQHQALIAGLGNPGYQDEGLGYYLISQIRRNFSYLPLRCVFLEEDIRNIIPYLTEFLPLLTVTSGEIGQAPGKFVIFPARRFNPRYSLIGISPASLNYLFQTFPYLREMPFQILAFQIHWREVGEELSPELCQSVKFVLRNFRNILNNLLTSTPRDQMQSGTTIFN